MERQKYKFIKLKFIRILADKYVYRKNPLMEVFSMALEILFSTLLQEAVEKPGIISKAYSMFHRFSLGNQLAALWQLTARGIDIGPIASFNAWKKLGRYVKKGEKALVLCMPITCKGEKENNGTTEEYRYTRFTWKANWFSLAQTSGKELSNSESPKTWDKVRALKSLEITEAAYESTDGNCQGYAMPGKKIAVNPVALYPFKTLFHEMAHVLLGHCEEHTMNDTEKTAKHIREAEAESVAYILINVLDMPGKDESRGYIQNWLNTEEIPEKSAHKIFAVADKILKAGKEADQKAEE